MKVLFLSPEAPWPLHGGGAYRTASLVHYFARFAEIDFILISETGEPAPLPAGLPVRQLTIALPAHSRHIAARYLRNARRALRGIPPLVDRLSGLDRQIRDYINQARYDIGIVEHFWCAPYVNLIADRCNTTVLDLHNIESILHERCAQVESGAIRAGHRRFARASRALEAQLLPRFSLVLAPSTSDAQAARAIAPRAAVEVYPNSFPWVDTARPVGKEAELPRVHDVVVFSGNFEYHPNIDAVRYLLSDIWPKLRARHPHARLRLVGRGDSFIRRFLPADPAAHGIEITGPVPSAFAEIARASVVIAPLRAGSGTRVKILEAWAAGRATVVTALAAEGLEAEHGMNTLVADTPEDFTEAVSRLLTDSALRDFLGRNGREGYETRWTWDAAWAQLEIYPQLTRSFGLHRYTG